MKLHLKENKSISILIFIIFTNNIIGSYISKSECYKREELSNKSNMSKEKKYKLCDNNQTFDCFKNNLYNLVDGGNYILLHKQLEKIKKDTTTKSLKEFFTMVHYICGGASIIEDFDMDIQELAVNKQKLFLDALLESDKLTTDALFKSYLPSGIIDAYDVSLLFYKQKNSQKYHKLYQKYFNIFRKDYRIRLELKLEEFLKISKQKLRKK